MEVDANDFRWFPHLQSVAGINVVTQRFIEFELADAALAQRVAQHLFPAFRIFSRMGMGLYLEGFWVMAAITAHSEIQLHTFYRNSSLEAACTPRVFCSG